MDAHKVLNLFQLRSKLKHGQGAIIQLDTQRRIAEVTQEISTELARMKEDEVDKLLELMDARIGITHAMIEKMDATHQ